jgi:hypothetical protein
MIKTVWLLLLLVTPWVAAKELYRYQDSAGLMVTSDTLSPEAAANGYDIVNEQGRVLQRLGPRPLQSQSSEQSEQDQYLLSSFSKVDEISVLKNRKLELLARDIKHLLSNIKGLMTREDQSLKRRSIWKWRGSLSLNPFLLRLLRCKNLGRK